MAQSVSNSGFQVIYIASCGEGINAFHLVESTLIQFPHNKITIVKVPHIRSEVQVDELIDKVKDMESIIVHTIVKSDLRQYLTRKGMEHKIVTIDLMGPVLSKIQSFLNQAPLEKPGLYRESHQVDLKQVSAIDFALAHDDGLSPESLDKAEIILLGLSRAGKTPLSMYMAVLGWKVANVPFVPGVPLPAILDEVDRRRIFALNINAKQLLSHRKMRQESLGVSEMKSAYASRKKIEEEIFTAHRYYIAKGYSILDISDKPIETSAEEIIEMITRRFKAAAHLS
ncbi:pyruvate, water dikinase regulatory protein [Desulfotignum phosphitoxidans]|jgi:regulator of PEP synthase PpsR (kinase-PPPase family)|uniref:Phosphotransferase YdiA n=1 Tax=Desulfotignum phosphitoxidans DSM 13687 TaxID=1286635 RepID=S0G1I6_9BACT|nr:pyruvate, water dikinase regulatory protein [Desulfotignum phosphitoxidans]EMS79334.1 phosphotransferase YdiA [Desulfotignum phosphitoxidans DSM 13687]